VNDGEDLQEDQEGTTSDQDDDGDLEDGIEWDDDTESVDHEDGEEDDEDDGEAAPPQSTDEVPFWFSHEDNDQVCKIMECYTRFLDVESEGKLCIRAPKKFVGKVRRTQVENEMFSTLDEVSIYSRDFKPLGVTLPLVRTVWVITSWDVTEGIPVHSFELHKDSLRAFWYQRTVGSDSFLYCRPLLHTNSEWQFQVSELENPVTYTCLHSNTPSYGPYIPSSRNQG